LMEESISEEFFQRELLKYPKIRSADWQGWKELRTQSQAPKQPTLTSPLHCIPVDSSKEFWENLNNFLVAHYPPTVAKGILEQFKLQHNKFISSLSLDDIERIATEFRN